MSHGNGEQRHRILRVSNKPLDGVCADFFALFGEFLFSGELLSGCFLVGVFGVGGGAAAFPFDMTRPLVVGIGV